MARKGILIKIPIIEQSNCQFNKFARIELDLVGGRPTKVLKRLVDEGFTRHWWDEKVFEDLIVFGWDRGYLKSDLPILSLPFRYFLQDMGYDKKKRLKEMEENGTKDR